MCVYVRARELWRSGLGPLERKIPETPNGVSGNDIGSCEMLPRRVLPAERVFRLKRSFFTYHRRQLVLFRRVPFFLLLFLRDPMFSCSEIRILTKSFFVRRWSSACFNHCFTFLLLLLGKGSSKVGNLSASGGGKIARGAQDFPPQASPVRFAGLAKGHPVLSEEEKKEKKKEKFRAVQMSSKPQQKHVLVHFVLHVSLFKNILL